MKKWKYLQIFEPISVCPDMVSQSWMGTKKALGRSPAL